MRIPSKRNDVHRTPTLFNFDVHSTPTILWFISENLTTGVTEWTPIS